MTRRGLMTTEAEASAAVDLTQAFWRIKEKHNLTDAETLRLSLDHHERIARMYLRHELAEERGIEDE